MNTLIIDDDRLTTTSLKRMLEEAGHKTSVSMNGEDALEMIGRNKFDLIICDVMMPGISGLSLVSVLRSVHLDFTPIIMISSLDNHPLVQAALKAGANDFITKPISPAVLEEKIKKFEAVK